MTQRYDQDAILGYVEGELTAPQREAFERLLAEDAALRQLVSDLAADRESLQQLAQRDSAPPGLVDAAVGHLERRMLLGGDDMADAQPALTGPISFSAEQTRRHGRTRWLVSAAVAAILLISFGIIFQTLILPQSRNRESAQQLAARTEPQPLLETPSESSAIEPPTSAPAMSDAAMAKTSPPAAATSSAAAPRINTKTMHKTLTKAGPEALDKAETETESDTLTQTSLVPKVLAKATPPSDEAVATSESASPSVAANQPLAEQPLAVGLGKEGTAGTLHLKTAPTRSVVNNRLNRMPDGVNDQPRRDVSAIRIAEPAARIEVVTARASDTEKQVVHWALSNNVQVISPPQSTAPVPAAAATAVPAKAADDHPSRSFIAPAPSPQESPPPTQPQARQQMMIVRMDESQVDQLADYLNTQSDQRATVVRQASQQAADAASDQLAVSQMLEAQKAQKTQESQEMKQAQPAPQEPMLFDWQTVLDNQLPLAPVQCFAQADRSLLPEPARPIDVWVQLVPPPSSPNAESSPTDD